MAYDNIPIVVKLSEDVDFRGRQCTLTEDVPDLSVYDFDHKASAISIHPGPNYTPGAKYAVSFFSGQHYTGAQLVLQPGGYDDLRHPYNFDNLISSVKFNQDIVGAYGITPIPVVAELYQHKNYQGRKLIVVQDLPDLHAWADFGDIVGSVKVFRGPNYLPGSKLKLFEDKSWSGGHIDLDVADYPDLGVSPFHFNDKASSVKVSWDVIVVSAVPLAPRAP
jgi:Beta/Gamma crystallin